MYAEVIVNLAHINSAFDYVIPPQMESQIQPGSLVEVPFGKQKLQGIVIQIRGETSVQEVKPIHAVIDEQPVLNANQMDLARWIAQATLTPISTCMALMLPPGLSQRADTPLPTHPWFKIRTQFVNRPAKKDHQ